MDSGLWFGQKPCLPGVATDGPACAWRAPLDGGLGLPVRLTVERKCGWDVAYLERVGMVGWPWQSSPSLDGCAGSHEQRDLPVEDGEDLGDAGNDLVQGGFGVLRSPCVSGPSKGGSLEIA